MLIDLDTVIKEENEAPKGNKSPLKTFEEYRANLTKNFDNENPKKAMCEMELLFQSDELKKHFK